MKKSISLRIYYFVLGAQGVNLLYTIINHMSSFSLIIGMISLVFIIGFVLDSELNNYR